MKFTVYTADICDALRLAAKCADPKSNTPILAAVKIDASDYCLILTATNFNVAAQVITVANIAEAGSVAVDAKFLVTALGKLTEDTVTFETVDNKLSLTSGGVVYKLATFDVNAFPSVKFDSVDGLSFNPVAFKYLLRHTIFAVDGNNDRAIFNTVNFRTQRDGDDISITAAGTNTRRISIDKLSAVAGDAQFNVNVPIAALKILLGELPKIFDGDRISIDADEKTFTAAYKNFRFKARLIEDDFPGFDKVLESPKDFSASFNVAEFKAALNCARVISADDSYKAVRLIFDGDRITVTANSDTRGSVTKSIDATAPVLEDEYGFNGDYIFDLLNAVDDERLTMYFGDKHDPATFKASADSDFVHVVTPVRL